MRRLLFKVGYFVIWYVVQHVDISINVIHIFYMPIKVTNYFNVMIISSVYLAW